MPKSIKDLFEVYRPKAKDEADFVDKHVTIKHKDRNGNGDDVFKGNTKYIKRKEERKGYDVGEDEKVYEDLRDQVLKSLVDAADELGEEFDEETLDAIAEEVLDELSKKTLGNYIKKSTGEVQKHSLNVGLKVKDDEPASADAMKAVKRRAGIGKAVDKLAKEELEIGEEALDELSKSTVGRYINKAKDSIDMTSYRSGIKDGTAISRNDPYTPNNPLEKKLSKRHKGIETAVKKLTKEEILNNFIDTYIPEDVEIPTPQERLVDCLADQDVSEQNIHILLSMFESLNEQNQMRMLESASDMDGINSLLDFAIANRGTE
jgi:hypothetical protein